MIYFWSGVEMKTKFKCIIYKYVRIKREYTISM